VAVASASSVGNRVWVAIAVRYRFCHQRGVQRPAYSLYVGVSGPPELVKLMSKIIVSSASGGSVSCGGVSIDCAGARIEI